MSGYKVVSIVHRDTRAVDVISYLREPIHWKDADYVISMKILGLLHRDSADIDGYAELRLLRHLHKVQRRDVGSLVDGKVAINNAIVILSQLSASPVRFWIIIRAMS